MAISLITFFFGRSFIGRGKTESAKQPECQPPRELAQLDSCRPQIEAHDRDCVQGRACMSAARRCATLGARNLWRQAAAVPADWRLLEPSDVIDGPS